MSLVELDSESLVSDWVLTQSVLNHLDEQGTASAVRRVARSLRPGGRWVSTVCFDDSVDRVEAGDPHGRRPNEFWRSLTNPKWLESVLEDSGLCMETVLDAAHPRGMDVFVARRPHSATCEVP